MGYVKGKVTQAFLALKAEFSKPENLDEVVKHPLLSEASAKRIYSNYMWSHPYLINPLIEQEKLPSDYVEAHYRYALPSTRTLMVKRSTSEEFLISVFLSAKSRSAELAEVIKNPHLTAATTISLLWRLQDRRDEMLVNEVTQHAFAQIFSTLLKHHDLSEEDVNMFSQYMLNTRRWYMTSDSVSLLVTNEKIKAVTRMLLFRKAYANVMWFNNYMESDSYRHMEAEFFKEEGLEFGDIPRMYIQKIVEPLLDKRQAEMKQDFERSFLPC